MIIFIHEERAYLSWLVRHRHGFVVDWLRKPTRKRPVLHRATCTEIKRSTSRQTHWTTGRHIKACGLDLISLRDWVHDESGNEPVYCEHCRPELQTPTEAQKATARKSDELTSLGKEIVNYVLEIAVMCLDGATSDYRVTLDDLAQFLGKSPAQLNAAVGRLVDDEYVVLDHPIERRAKLPNDLGILPTAKSLQRIPAFQKLSPNEIGLELKRLRREAHE